MQRVKATKHAEVKIASQPKDDKAGGNTSGDPPTTMGPIRIKHPRQHEDYRMDMQGNIIYIPPFVMNPRVKALSLELGKIRKAKDVAALAAFVSGAAARLQSEPLDEMNFSIARSEVVRAGVLLADIQGDGRSAQQWLSLCREGYRGDLVGAIFPIYALDAGVQEDELYDYLQASVNSSSELYRLFSDYFGGVTPAVRSHPKFYAELHAALEFAGSDDWLAEIHARRALRMYPAQAASAAILMPILCRTGRPEEAVRLGEVALRHCVGMASNKLRAHLVTAKQAVQYSKGWKLSAKTLVHLEIAR